jgi:hypothetical protein
VENGGTSGKKLPGKNQTGDDTAILLIRPAKFPNDIKMPDRSFELQAVRSPKSKITTLLPDQFVSQLSSLLFAIQLFRLPARVSIPQPVFVICSKLLLVLS